MYKISGIKVVKANLSPVLLLQMQETGIAQHRPWFMLSSKHKQEVFTCRENNLCDNDWPNASGVITDAASCKTGSQICGCVSPLWSTTAAACLHLAAGGAPVHFMCSIWSLTVFPSVGPTGSGEGSGATARRTRPLTGLRGEERPPNTTIPPPGKEVAVWWSLTPEESKWSVTPRQSHDQNQPPVPDFLPSSPDASTLTELQPLQPLKRSLGAALLPALLEPPVRRTCFGPSRQEAIPRPSTLSWTGSTLRTKWLRGGGTTAGTAGLGAK